MTAPDTLSARYDRIVEQLRGLFTKTTDPVARMATAAAVLHHKQPHFFWTGFYRLVGQDLVVGPYQGPLACQILERGRGVCWTCAGRGEPVLVPDVHAFPGHIACDSRSQSEVVVPVWRLPGLLAGVLDVDSEAPGAFGEADVQGLQAVAALIFADPPKPGGSD